MGEESDTRKIIYIWGEGIDPYCISYNKLNEGLNYIL